MRIRLASIKDINEIIKILYRDYTSNNFYSEYKGNILKYILLKECYLFYKNKSIYGILFVSKGKNSIIYIPSLNSNLSFFKVLFFIKCKLQLSGYRLSINYSKLNISTLKRYYSFHVLSNIKHMYLDFKSLSPIDETIVEGVNIRKLITNSEEPLRVELQNEIFGHIKGRTLLSLREVLVEEKDPSFIEKLCFVIEFNCIPVGYGQVIKISEKYKLVNLGIIPDYRGQGLSTILLNAIIKECINNGINKLYLTVDSENNQAINLYRKAGFEDIISSLTIII